MRLVPPSCLKALVSALTDPYVDDKYRGRSDPAALVARRPTVVRFVAGLGGVEAGCCEGIMKRFEVEEFSRLAAAVSRAPKRLRVKWLRRLGVGGVLYAEEPGRRIAMGSYPLSPAWLCSTTPATTSCYAPTARSTLRSAVAP